MGLELVLRETDVALLRESAPLDRGYFILRRAGCILTVQGEIRGAKGEYLIDYSEYVQFVFPRVVYDNAGFLAWIRAKDDCNEDTLRREALSHVEAERRLGMDTLYGYCVAGDQPCLHIIKKHYWGTSTSSSLLRRTAQGVERKEPLNVRIV